MYGLTEAFRSTSLDPGSGRRASRQRRHRHPLRRSDDRPRRRQRGRAWRRGRTGPCRPAGRPGLLARPRAHRRALSAPVQPAASPSGRATGREGRGRADPLPRPRRCDDQGQRQPLEPDRDRGSGAGQRRGPRGARARHCRTTNLGQAIDAGRRAEGRGCRGAAARLFRGRASRVHAARADRLARCACRSAPTASSIAPRWRGSSHEGDGADSARGSVRRRSGS